MREVVAGRADAPANVLVALAGDSKIKVRRAVVDNEVCPADALPLLVSDPDSQIRWDAAQHRNATRGVHAKAASEGDSSARQALAQLPELHSEVAGALCDDSDWHVREQLALSTSDEQLLQRLARDSNPRVRGQVAFNPLATEGRRRLLARDPWAETRAILAACRDTPDDVLFELVQDKSPNVRFWLTIHGQNRRLMKLLMKDPDRMVAETARRSLKNPVEGIDR